VSLKQYACAYDSPRKERLELARQINIFIRMGTWHGAHAEITDVTLAFMSSDHLALPIYVLMWILEFVHERIAMHPKRIALMESLVRTVRRVVAARGSSPPPKSTSTRPLDLSAAALSASNRQRVARRELADARRK